jgi:4-alpha-glucanotransferase
MPWQEWPAPIRDRNPAALEEWRAKHAREVGFHRFLQYQFSRQWASLKAYANSKGIKILGDIPIYVASYSCDTWVHRRLFALGPDGRPVKTGGVPPDFFSADGQNWLNPVFDWEACKEDGYGWWIDRIRRNLRLYDFLRLDHFRGFEAYWEIPGGHVTAANGKWAKGPGKALFEAMEAALGPLPFLAEDLGYITPNVDDLKNTFAWPGLMVYQFHHGLPAAAPPKEPPAADSKPARARGDGFGGGAAVGDGTLGGTPGGGSPGGGSPRGEEAGRDGAGRDGAGHGGAEGGGAGPAAAKRARRPSTADFLQVCYSGTHDNDTLAGWVRERLMDERAPKTQAANRIPVKRQPVKRRGSAPVLPPSAETVRAHCRRIIASLYDSDAMWAMIPLQDVLFLGAEARMNKPGTSEGNWEWSAAGEAFTKESAQFLMGLAEGSGRFAR